MAVGERLSRKAMLLHHDDSVGAPAFGCEQALPLIYAAADQRS